MKLEIVTHNIFLMKVEMVFNKQNLAISIFVSISVKFLSGASAFIWVKKCI
jgi:hypothetical protein